MKKKLLLSAILICIGILAFGIINASAETYGDLTYTISNNKVTITDCNTSASGELVIPDTIEGYPITFIGEAAFENCNKLTNILMPDSVTSIGNAAFMGCTSLVSITIPNSVTFIGELVFTECKGLINIDVDENNLNYISVDGVLFNKGKTELIQYPIGNSRTDYVIPDSVKSINQNAFSHGKNLKNITIPDSVTCIASSVFYDTGYYNDKNNWSNSVLYIDNHLIEVDESIVSCNIREGTLTIAGSAFFGRNKLKNVTIPDSVVSIGNYAFYNCNSLTNVIIPDSVTSIGMSSFCFCENLTDIIIPDSVTSIGSFAFAYCIKLESITIPDDVYFIGDHAFMHCREIQSMAIPEKVISIGNETFFYCKKLSSITIPSSVVSIGNEVFSFCDSLSTVYYAGTEDEFNKIEIGDNNDYLLSAKKVYNFETGVEIIEATSTENSLKFVSKASINPNDEISTFGTTFIPLWLFELGATNTGIVIYDNATHNIKNGQTYGATLSGIPSLFKDMAIVGKSFIKDSSGNYIWSDAQYASVSDTTLKDVE